MTAKAWFVMLVASTVCALPSTASAQDANDERIAETLFQEGRALLSAGHYADACPKFEASQKAGPSTGTQLNLADCYEKDGKTASAWALFRHVARAAKQQGRADREAIAIARASSLESRLSKMTIVVPGPEIEIRRNGTVVDAALLGSPEPLDPGSYVIAASATGKTSWSQTVVVVPEAKAMVVTIPQLADEPPASPAAAADSRLMPTVLPVSTPAAPTDSHSALRTAAWVTGALGVVGLGVGTAFGFIALNNQQSAGCPGNACPNAAAASTLRNAESAATASTIGFVVGGALVTAGVVLWIVAPKGDRASAAGLSLTPQFAGTSTGVNLGGAF